jgi:oligopeptidase B
MLSRIQETDSGVPVLERGFYYYTRTEEGRSYPIHCRKRAPAGAGKSVGKSASSPDAIPTAEEIVLDENEVAEGKSHCDVRDMEISPSGDLVAYTTDFDGGESYTVRVRRLSTGEELSDTMAGTDGGVEWGRSDDVLFYVTHDEAKRSHKVWRHLVGQKQGDDELLFEEKDALFSVGAGVTRSGRFLLIESGSIETSEAWIVDLDAPEAESGACASLAGLLRVVEPRSHGLRYDVNVWQNSLIVVHNDGGAKKNGEIAYAPLDAMGRANWTPIVPYQADVQVSSASAFKNHLVVSGRQEGSKKVWLVGDAAFNAATATGAAAASASASASAGAGAGAGSYVQLVAVPTDEQVYSLWLSGNREFDTDKLRYGYCSPVTPVQTLELSVSKLLGDSAGATATSRSVREPTLAELAPVRSLLKQRPTPNVDLDAYSCKRIVCPVPRTPTSGPGDTVNVPISLVWRPDCHKDGGALSAPTILYGYGSYGISIDPGFSTWIFSILDRGGLYAIAHVRGGGEMGRPWYEDMGKFKTKENTFADFAACAEHLATSGWSDPKRIGCLGRSAGGLLVGRSITMRPDLWACAVADVPFVDLMSTMCDETIPLTIGEWAEWGNPNETEFHDYMLSYSPIDTVPKGAKLPPVLLTAGFYDPRVQYWEPLKFAQRLRQHAGPGSGAVLCKTDMSSGHFSASDRYRYIREQAFEAAYFLDKLGMH